MTQKKTSNKQIIIMGEPDLISELAHVCNASSYSVITKKIPGQKSLPEFCIQTGKLPNTPSCAFELSNINFNAKKINVQLLDKTLPPQTLIFSSAVTTTITEQSTWIKHPDRLIGISALPTLLKNKLIEISASIHTSPDILSHAKSILTTLGKETSQVQDRVGMVLPRILCMLINEAYFALMEQVASSNDIDLAMKLGTNYPEGPITWSQQIGLPQVVAVLDAIHSNLREERYRVSPLLRQLSSSSKK